MLNGISPIELSGTVGRTQDFSIMKHQDDAKPVIDQGNSLVQVEKNVESQASTVIRGNRTETNTEGGDGKGYAGDGGRQRKKKDEVPKEGRVMVKRPGGFDISV